MYAFLVVCRIQWGGGIIVLKYWYTEVENSDVDYSVISWLYNLPALL